MRFEDLPLAVQVQLACIGPLLFGLVAGFLLRVSVVGYWSATALSIAGGMLGGAEHGSMSGAAGRGSLAGAWFGTGVVIAAGLSTGPALAPLPSPAALLVPISAGAGALLATLGARLAARQRRRRTSAQATLGGGTATS